MDLCAQNLQKAIAASKKVKKERFNLAASTIHLPYRSLNLRLNGVGLSAQPIDTVALAVDNRRGVVIADALSWGT